MQAGSSSLTRLAPWSSYSSTHLLISQLQVSNQCTHTLQTVVTLLEWDTVTINAHIESMCALIVMVSHLCVH